MAQRNPGTSKNNSQFDAATIELVWQKGRMVLGVDPRVRRKDANGAWIDRAAYGNTTHNGTGWEIDHIQPVSRGGADGINNLQPLQWQNNRAKADNWPSYQYAVQAA